MAAVAIPAVVGELAAVAPVLIPLVKQAVLWVEGVFRTKPKAGAEKASVVLQSVMTAADQLVKSGVLATLPQSSTVQSLIEAVVHVLKDGGYLGADTIAPLATSNGVLATVPIMATLSFGGTK